MQQRIPQPLPEPASQRQYQPKDPEQLQAPWSAKYDRDRGWIIYTDDPTVRPMLNMMSADAIDDPDYVSAIARYVGFYYDIKGYLVPVPPSSDENYYAVGQGCICKFPAAGIRVYVTQEWLITNNIKGGFDDPKYWPHGRFINLSNPGEKFKDNTDIETYRYQAGVES